MRVFATKAFARFSSRLRISDASLIGAVERAGRGLVDADLGGGVIKQRVARQGKGRSGGYRTLIAFRIDDAAVFLFGFAKNERENIDARELSDWRLVAGRWLEEPSRIDIDMASGNLIEVKNDSEN